MFKATHSESRWAVVSTDFLSASLTDNLKNKKELWNSVLESIEILNYKQGPGINWEKALALKGNNVAVFESLFSFTSDSIQWFLNTLLFVV